MQNALRIPVVSFCKMYKNDAYNLGLGGFAMPLESGSHPMK